MLHTELLTKVWGPEYRDDLQYLRVWISRVRRKLGAKPGEPGRIKTFQGIGYLLDVEPGGGSVTGEDARSTEAPAAADTDNATPKVEATASRLTSWPLDRPIRADTSPQGARPGALRLCRFVSRRSPSLGTDFRQMLVERAFGERKSAAAWRVAPLLISGAVPTHETAVGRAGLPAEGASDDHLPETGRPV